MGGTKFTDYAALPKGHDSTCWFNFDFRSLSTQPLNLREREEESVYLGARKSKSRSVSFGPVG